ncbi:MAG: mutY [Chitinophagaceae bacterium]|nr:mutY [Chitinophagaceae bacterium]
MPWKGEKDPYRIWLSEVILQQTRVEQGLGYYRRFVERYPTILKLAKAKDDEVYKLWEGLGYYSRCKNLLATAREIAADRKGKFPDTYDSILQLKGVGPYIASAISSFAYNLPYAVLDGNVFRVLARVYGVDTPIDTTGGKNEFTAIASSNLDRQNPGEYNQAIMDFGATVCKPMVPACSSCPMRKICKAFNNGLVNQLPVKEKVLRKKYRWFYYFLFELEGTYFVRRRTGNDIWQNLNEFYLFESPEELEWDAQKLNAWMRDQLGVTRFRLKHISPLQSQQLTHQKIQGQFFQVELRRLPQQLEHYDPVTGKQIARLAFPRFINQFLEGMPALEKPAPAAHESVRKSKPRSH